MGNNIVRRWILMNKFEGAKKVGLRSKTSGKLIAVYPHNIKETEEDTVKAVRDWYYQTSCAAEDELLSAYVDSLTEDEIKSKNL